MLFGACLDIKGWCLQPHLQSPRVSELWTRYIRLFLPRRCTDKSGELLRKLSVKTSRTGACWGAAWQDQISASGCLPRAAQWCCLQPQSVRAEACHRSHLFLSQATEVAAPASRCLAQKKKKKSNKPKQKIEPPPTHCFFLRESDSRVPYSLVFESGISGTNGLRISFCTSKGTSEAVSSCLPAQSAARLVWAHLEQTNLQEASSRAWLSSSCDCYCWSLVVLFK